MRLRFWRWLNWLRRPAGECDGCGMATCPFEAYPDEVDEPTRADR